jgi:hypothetical protein
MQETRRLVAIARNRSLRSGPAAGDLHGAKTIRTEVSIAAHWPVWSREKRQLSGAISDRGGPSNQEGLNVRKNPFLEAPPNSSRNEVFSDTKLLPLVCNPIATGRWLDAQAHLQVPRQPT